MQPGGKSTQPEPSTVIDHDLLVPGESLVVIICGHAWRLTVVGLVVKTVVELVVKTVEGKRDR